MLKDNAPNSKETDDRSSTVSFVDDVQLCDKKNNLHFQIQFLWHLQNYRIGLLYSPPFTLGELGCLVEHIMPHGTSAILIAPIVLHIMARFDVYLMFTC